MYEAEFPPSSDFGSGFVTVDEPRFADNSETEISPYTGEYNGAPYTDETGYPNYSFGADTDFGEQWTLIKTTDKTEKTVISNGVIIKTEDKTNGITNEYTYGSDFKDLPTLIKNTITDDEKSKDA